MWELFLHTKAAGTQHCRGSSRQAMGTGSLHSPACKWLCTGAKGEWGFPAQIQALLQGASDLCTMEKKHTPKSGEKEETRQQRTRTCPVGTVGASTGEPIAGQTLSPSSDFLQGQRTGQAHHGAKL